jgi:hypothetical protein
MALEPAIAIPTPAWRIRLNRLRGWWHWKVAGKFPRLVWPGDEVDVIVTFREAKLPQAEFNPADGFPASALAYLGAGRMAEIERSLGEIGITFDKGGGPGGRDWEWDYSLKGPISVRFKRRAEKPEWRS